MGDSTTPTDAVKSSNHPVSRRTPPRDWLIFVLLSLTSCLELMLNPVTLDRCIRQDQHDDVPHASLTCNLPIDVARITGGGSASSLPAMK